jgi:hypothetical protein
LFVLGTTIACVVLLVRQRHRRSGDTSRSSWRAGIALLIALVQGGH